MKWIIMLGLGLGIWILYVEPGNDRAEDHLNGFDEYQPGIWIENGYELTDAQALLQQWQQAKQPVQQVFGVFELNHRIYACLSQHCFEQHTRSKNRGGIYLGQGRILLSPRGLNQYTMAHELVHAEFRQRVHPEARSNMPVWFEEGLAVVLSQHPRYQPQGWERLQAYGISAVPLVRLAEAADWRTELAQADAMLARLPAQARLPNPVYLSAATAVRQWYHQAGASGLDELMKKMNQGQTFSAVVPALEFEVVR